MDQLSDANKGAFRVKDWWWSKAALLMGMIYLFAEQYHISFQKFIPLSILSLATIVGFASMGYLVNDLFDIEQDRKAGKKNFLADKPAVVVLMLFLISAAFVFVPWLYLPKDHFSYALIVLQLLLFLIYSISPFRFKERSYAGLVTDALYAHGIPPVLAAYTFALAAGVPFAKSGIILLFAWQTTAGFRNILLHQWEDVEADQKSGSKNFVASLGPSRFYTVILGLIIIELLLCLSFFALLCRDNALFVFCVGVVLLLAGYVWPLFKGQTMAAFLNSFWKYFPNNVYEKWLPVIYLILLCSGDLRFAILLVLHLLFFNLNFYVQSADKIYGRWKSVAFKGMLVSFKIGLSYPVNYSIYYSFRLFGVDLKKQNISAMEYFRGRKTGDEKGQ